MSLLDTLISHWKLDEASGNALDAHASNNLTDFNTVGTGTGKVGNARDFERGNSEYLSGIGNANLATGDFDFTVSFWLNVESFGGYEIPIGNLDRTLFKTAGTPRLTQVGR